MTITVPEGYVYVCNVGEMPERGKKIIHFGDTTILLIACEKGIFAVEDRCPQGHGSIALATVKDCQITCRCHGSTYCLLTGKYISGGLSPRSHDMLRIFKLDVYNGQYYVQI
jgi:nitrite reductase/ring-hydroxylating ferredoxin subunit